MVEITRQDIVTQLKALGVAECDLLLVHSSLSSFGHVIGGAATVAAALKDIAGDTGSVFVPTFNFGKLAYDSATTPSLTGAISESVRCLPGSIRSSHPTHSVSGFGPQAQRLLATHPLTHPFGSASPIFELWKKNACIVLLGCDHRSSSVIHVAEELAKLPYLNRTRVGRILDDGKEREIVVTRPPCSRGFNVVDEPLRRAGKIRHGMIGSCRVMLLQAVDVVAAALQLLETDLAALTCREPDCEFCVKSREMLLEKTTAA